MLRSNALFLSVLGLALPLRAQDDVPQSEPTNRPVAVNLKTANVFSFCRQNQSLAFVSGQYHTLVHQHFPLEGMSLSPLKFDGSVRLLSCSPDGKSLAVLVNDKIRIRRDRRSPDSDEVIVPLSTTLEEPYELKWAANSNVLFALRRGEPATVTRVPIEDPDQTTDIVFQNAAGELLPNADGSLLLVFNRSTSEIWREGKSENKIVNGRAEHIVGSPDGRFVAFMADGKLQLWTLAPLGKGSSVAAYGAETIHFSANGERLLVSEVDGRVQCFLVGDNGQLKLTQEYSATGGCGWLSDNGKLGACLDHSQTSRLMRVFQCDARAESAVPVITKSVGLGGYDPEIFPREFRLTQNGRRGLVVWPAGRLELFDMATRLPDWGCRVPDLAELWLIGDGDLLMTTDKSGVLQFHDTSVGRVRRQVVDVQPASPAGRHARDTPHRFQALPDGRHCVVWCGPNLRQFAIVEMSTGKTVARAQASDGGVQSVRSWQASDDGSTVCVAGDRVQVLQTGFQSSVPGKAGNNARFHLAVKARGLNEPVHGIYDAKTGRMRRTLKWEFVDASSLTNWGHVSRDGQLCALVARRSDGGGSGVEVRDTVTGRQVAAVPLSDTDFSWLDFTQDQTGMWVVTRQALLRLDLKGRTLQPFLTDSETDTQPAATNAETPTPLPQSTWQTTQFQCFAESDTGWIATGHRRGFVNIWSVKDQKRYAFLRCGTEVVRSLAFSPDGKYLMSWCADRNQVQITDVSSILLAKPPAPQAENEKEREPDLDF